MVRGGLKTYLDLVRVPQYIKNLIIWAPLFFGGRLYDRPAAGVTWWAFAVFCLIASAVYIFNDLRDVDFDRQHPRKKNRPIASGAISSRRAGLLALILLALAAILALVFLPAGVIGLCAVYLALNLAYSWRLKHLAVVDVLCIGVSFVLRVFVGGLAAEVEVSQWLIMMTFLLALFLALAKRRDDLILSANGKEIRPAIDGYNFEFLTAGLMIMGAVTIVCYILYTVSPEVMAKHHAPYLYLTAFWVIAGLLRYLQVTLVKQESGSPTQVLIRDRFLLATVALWAVNMFVVLYLLGKG